MNRKSEIGWPWLTALVWLVSMSVLTVLKHAPAALNADILLNSIMSLQKVTLFYWGQNRLLSILPFIVAPATDPAVNLALVLLITYLFFSGCCY